MREIKFRQPFYTYEGKFVGFSYWGRLNPDYPKEFASPADRSGCYSKPDEQHTGLKDKNGREIYEGDIMAVNSNALVECVIIFEDGAFRGDFGEIDNHAIDQFWASYFEIIGNIHEHPHLIQTA